MKKWKGIQGISLLMAAAMTLGGCTGGCTASNTTQTKTQEAAEAAETAAIAVRAVNAELGTLTISNEFVGTVSPQQQVSVIPMVSGEVDAVYFEVGDTVEAGDVLFHIDDEAARLQEESARLQRQSIDATAKAQLGAGQVMSNISMQSNIKSLEFQIQNAKDQLKAAEDGVADAEQAKIDIADALSAIDENVSSLKAEQTKRENVISNAQGFVQVGFDSLTNKTTYNWMDDFYTWPEDPSHYTWKNPDAASENNVQENLEDVLANIPTIGLPEAESEQPSESSEASESQETSESAEVESESAEVESESVEVESESAESESESGTVESAETDETAAKTEAESESVGESVQDSTVTETSEETESTAKTASETLKENGAAGIGELFSVEVITYKMPFHYASAEQQGKPALNEVTADEAWELYNRQQKYNAAKAAAESMGYDAEAIGSQSASSEIASMSAEILMLEYQASELRSSQSTLDSSIAQAEMTRDATEKTIEFYEDNLKDAQMTAGIQSGQVYEDTAYTIATQQQAADVAIKSAQMQLEFYSPKAPISGTVISKAVEVYGMTQPGYAAYVISNQDAMKVTFLVSGQVKESLTVGMPVTLQKSGAEYPGTITEIGAAVQQQSGGLFSVTAITEAGGDDLASGTAAKVVVDTFKTENAILIPYDAVHFESEQAYVFVIQDGILVRTPITLGLMNEDTVEVTEGLTANAQIVSTWSSQLEEGAAVRVIGEAKE